ncbi:MAG TPA: IclR family transcriptional regulator, partial [Anaerolineales bacterium]|nr:IclR family transcriptional regulator [Anaerolineales bacterium]
DIALKPQKPRDFSQVQVINRACAILRAVRISGGLTLSQLSRQVGLARTTVYRIVATLESEGLLSTASPGGKIQLGIELIPLGAAVRTDIRHELRPYLEELSLALDETVDLAILDKDHVLFLDQVVKLHRLHAVSGIGLEFPLHCTANGKALLSTYSNDELLKLLPEKLQVFTPHTIQTRQHLLDEISDVRQHGVAYDREEHTLGICAVGAVIYAPMETMAAISIPVPSVRFYGYEEKLISELLETCQVINARFRQ